VADAVESIDGRLKELEGETPKTKKGYKASEAKDSVISHPLLDAALKQLADEQGLDLAKLGVKDLAPQNDLERIARRMVGVDNG
jgi:hypothetical protein